MAQGVEIASAYVSLIPSAQGIGDAIAKELGAPVARAAQDTGADAGKRISDGLLSGTKDTGKKLITALGLAAVGAIAVKSAIDVEDAQNTIVRTTGATGKAAEGLEASFRNVASGTAASFETVSTTLSQLYQRTGLQGEALEGLTSQVVSFNRQFKDAPITVDALTKSLAGFNVPGKEMGTVLDHLFIISQKTGVPLSEILATMQAAGPIARQFGLSVEDTATLLANLNKAGVDANQILPGLKKVFKDAADAGKDPQEALKGIITQIDALVKAGDEIGARNLAVQVFGPRGVGLVDAVISGKLSLDDFNKSISVTGDGIIDTGKKTGTLAGALGVLRNNVQLALASFATPGLEAANELLRSVLPTIKDLGQEFAKLPDPLKLSLVGIVGLGLGIGKLGDFATNSLPGIQQLFGNLQNTSSVAGKVGQAAVGAGVGIGAFAATTWALHAAQDAIFGTTKSYEDKLKDLAAATENVNGPTEELVLHFTDVIKAFAEANPNAEGATITLGAFKEVAQGNLGVAARLAEQFPKTSATYRGMQLVLTGLVDAQNKNAEGADAQGSALERVTGQVDKTSDAYKKALDVFGAWVAGGAAALGVTESTLDGIATSAQTFAQSLDSSVASATDPFSKFSGQLDVSQEDFEKFFVGSQLGAADWANRITDLVNRGVDQGILQEIAKAGPNSKPLLDAFVREVDAHGVEWVNSVAQAGEAATAETEKAFNAMVVSTAIHTAEQQTIVEATTADMKDGGTRNLEALLHNSDTNLAAMAYGALLKLGEIRAGVEGLPTTAHPIVVPIVAQISPALRDLLPFGRTPALSTDDAAAIERLFEPRASGGPVGPGSFLVGERNNGGEILTLAPGSRGFVTNAADTGRILDKASAPSGAFAGTTVNYYGPLDDPAARTRGIFSDLRNAAVLAGL